MCPNRKFRVCQSDLIDVFELHRRLTPGCLQGENLMKVTFLLEGRVITLIVPSKRDLDPQRRLLPLLTDPRRHTACRWSAAGAE